MDFERHKKLNAALVDIVQDYSLVSFIPLMVEVIKCILIAPNNCFNVHFSLYLLFKHNKVLLMRVFINTFCAYNIKLLQLNYQDNMCTIYHKALTIRTFIIGVLPDFDLEFVTTYLPKWWW